MRSVSAVLVAALLVACGPAEEPAPEAPAPPPAPTLADFAGTWQNSVTLTGVADPIPSTMTGTAAGTDWTMALAGRPAISLTVAIVGDSLVSTSAEYESILRPGVMTVVRTAGVLHNGMMMGNVVVTYKTATGDEVVTGTMQSTRAPN